MNIPAYTSPTLCLGRTFDYEKLSARADIPSSNDIPTKKRKINRFSFKYQVVKSSKDVSDLLGISSGLSLQLKVSPVKMEGAGRYIKENKVQEGKTSLLVVMKCTTLVETIEGSWKVREGFGSGESFQSLGTHYVRSVTYGGEMVASLTFKSLSESSRDHIKGGVEGKLDVGEVGHVGLKAALDQLSKKCSDLSDISIQYYATDLPDQLPITVDGLVSLIKDFPSRFKNISDGDGVPMQFELLPVNNVIPNVKACLQQQALPFDLEDFESRFDDLQNTQALVDLDLEEREDDDVEEFCSEITGLLRKFKEAIQTMNSIEGQKKIKECTAEYQKARGGRDLKGKFAREWKKIIRGKAPVATVKLPSGDPLTIVLFGKSGNGKSSTGNSIVGFEHFEASPSGSAVTKFCTAGRRKDERELTVIDTPGIMDTAPISDWEKTTENVTGPYSVQQLDILRELAKVFVMSPDGLDAIIITIEYGGRFVNDDAKALKMLKSFFGPEAQPYIILILTHGDKAASHAKKNKRSIEDQLTWYISTLPDWVRRFLGEIGERRLLFDNSLNPDEKPDDCKKQVSKLLQIIDEVRMREGPFVHRLTNVSKEVLGSEIKKAMEESGLTEREGHLCQENEEIARKLKDTERNDEERRELEIRLAELEKELAEVKCEMGRRKNQTKEEVFNSASTDSGGVSTTSVSSALASIGFSTFGGCYPSSAIIYDTNFRGRRMESLKVGEEVLVITNNGIQSDTVITFIHRQPEIVEEFLKIVTIKENILLITADHLLFVEVMGRATAIPARDVNIGDKVYVKGSHGSEKDSVRSINTVNEKGAYAPVTLSGTILVNDVHTSCYFDMLSHEWSHRAMSIARALHYMSPSMMQRISAIGEKDGFPGWSRLAHTILTLLD